jgi:hypothetical protein
MSKFMDNKSIIHIVSQIIGLFGVTFYFNQKNKKLMSHIEDLVQRLEEQEATIERHENLVKKLNERVFPKSNTEKSKYSISKKPNSYISDVDGNNPSPVVIKEEPPKIEIIVSDDESETDLDDELKTEISELESNDSNDVDDIEDD